jgi:hypothetical protein
MCILSGQDDPMIFLPVIGDPRGVEGVKLVLTSPRLLIVET